MIEQPILPIQPAMVPVIIRDQSGMTRELVLVVTERGSAWPLSWIELPCEGTG